jgi:hypothetical protein
MRTSAEVIRELEAEAPFHTHVALVVGFEHTTLFIFSDMDDKITALNEMIHQGGEPVGFLAYDYETDRQLTVAWRPLEELEGEAWAEQYLERLADASAEGLRALGQQAS